MYILNMEANSVPKQQAPKLDPIIRHPAHEIYFENKKLPTIWDLEVILEFHKITFQNTESTQASRHCSKRINKRPNQTNIITMINFYQLMRKA
jgi:hypothetical protein